jgi:hypothetical protein
MNDDGRLAIFSVCPKGGTGKSMFSRGLVDYYRARGAVCAAYDGDSKNESLFKMYGERDETGKLYETQDPIRGVRPFAADKLRDRDLLLDQVEVHAMRSVTDLRGGGESDLVAVLDDADAFFAAYEQEGIAPVVVIVINEGDESPPGLIATVNALGPRPRYVVVKNLYTAASDQFLYFDGYKKDGKVRYGSARRFCEQNDIAVIEMPRLDPDTRIMLVEERLTFATGEKSDRMTFTHRTRVKTWRSVFAANLAGTVLDFYGAPVPA